MRFHGRSNWQDALVSVHAREGLGNVGSSPTREVETQIERKIMQPLGHFVGTEELVAHRCWCGILHAIPRALHDNSANSANNGKESREVYCPLGHKWVLGATTKLSDTEKALQQERAAHDQCRAARREIEAQNAHIEASLLRIRKRAKQGICPCCHRTVKQLASHMQDKHPNFRP